MKTPRWIIVLMAFLAVMAVAELVFLWILRGSVQESEKKIGKLNEQVADLAYDKESDKRSGMEDRLKAIELRLHGIGQRIDDAASGEGDEDVGAALDHVIGQNGEKPVHQNLRERLRERTSVDSIAEKLGLNAGQKTQFLEATKRARDGLLEVATLAKTQDQAFLEELKGLVKERMPLRKKLMTIKDKLTTTPVPGTQTSYLGRVMEIRTQVVSDLQEIMTEDQFRQFRGMRISPFLVHESGDEGKGGLFGLGLAPGQNK